MRDRGEDGFNLSGVWFIIGVNIILYIFTIFYESLIPQLGLQASQFTSAPWKILTNLFIHADFFHIFANMVTLYFFGTYLTMLVGERNFLLTYFLGGLLGNAVFMLWALYAPWAEPYARDLIAIGASGAVFAVGGALAVLRPKAKVLLYFFIPMPLWVPVIIGFLILTFVSLALDLPISWQAHLGGLLLGLGAGFIFRRSERYRPRR